MSPPIGMRNLSHTQIFALVGVILLALLLAISRSRRWLGTRLRTLDYLGDYFKAAQAHFVDVFWGVAVGTGAGFAVGVAVPFLLLAVYSQFQTPPYFVNWAAVICAIFLAGYYVWRADHVRLQQKIEVTRVRKHSWSIETGGEGMQYYFEIVNKSEAATIYGVRVQLQEIIPDNRDWLPVTLHQQHDNFGHDGSYAESFDLNPLVPKNIDLFSAATGGSLFQVSHIVPHTPFQVSFSVKHRLKVTISGQDVPPLLVWFDVWKNEAGIPQCEMVQSN